MEYFTYYFIWRDSKEMRQKNDFPKFWCHSKLRLPLILGILKTVCYIMFSRCSWKSSLSQGRVKNMSVIKWFKIYKTFNWWLWSGNLEKKCCFFSWKWADISKTDDLAPALYLNLIVTLNRLMIGSWENLSENHKIFPFICNKKGHINISLQLLMWN